MKKIAIFIAALCLLSVSAQDDIETGSEEPMDIDIYMPVDPSVVETNDNVRKALNFGADSVATLIRKKMAFSKVFAITDTYSISQQDLINGVNYYFDVALRDEFGIIYRTQFRVFDPSSTTNDTMTQYTYAYVGQDDTQIELFADFEDFFVDQGAFVNENAFSDDYNDLETLYSHDNEYINDIYNSEPNVEGVIGGWESTNNTAVETDDQLKEVLDFGANTVLDIMFNDGAIAAGEYEITEVLKIQSQVVNGINYLFEVQVKNDDQYLLLSYIVNDPAGVGARKVTNYSYEVYA